MNNTVLDKRQQITLMICSQMLLELEGLLKSRKENAMEMAMKILNLLLEAKFPENTIDVYLCTLYHHLAILHYLAHGWEDVVKYSFLSLGVSQEYSKILLPLIGGAYSGLNRVDEAEEIYLDWLHQHQVDDAFLEPLRLIRKHREDKMEKDIKRIRDGDVDFEKQFLNGRYEYFCSYVNMRPINESPIKEEITEEGLQVLASDYDGRFGLPVAVMKLLCKVWPSTFEKMFRLVLMYQPFERVDGMDNTEFEKLKVAREKQLQTVLSKSVDLDENFLVASLLNRECVVPLYCVMCQTPQKQSQMIQIDAVNEALMKEISMDSKESNETKLCDHMVCVCRGCAELFSNHEMEKPEKLIGSDELLEQKTHVKNIETSIFEAKTKYSMILTMFCLLSFHSGQFQLFSQLSRDLNILRKESQEPPVFKAYVFALTKNDLSYLSQHQRISHNPIINEPSKQFTWTYLVKSNQVDILMRFGDCLYFLTRNPSEKLTPFSNHVLDMKSVQKKSIAQSTCQGTPRFILDMI